MSIASSSTSMAGQVRTHRGRLPLYLQLTKARLSAMVLLTTAAGYVVATIGPLDWVRLCWTMLGTAMAAASASALNQVWEVGRDRLMVRTQSRPLPAGLMSTRHALLFGIAVGYAGVMLLAAVVNLSSALLALLTIVLYVLAYTPLKTRSTLNTLVGAVCGAIPPVIGWVAAADSIGPGAWLLAALLFVWQLPHFLSLAWLYRADYARGGFVMLPNRDGQGIITGRVVMLASAVLLLIGLAGLMVGLAGLVFAAASTLAGLWIWFRGACFWLDRSDANARRVFRVSLIYLCLVLGLLLLDRGPAALLLG